MSELQGERRIPVKAGRYLAGLLFALAMLWGWWALENYAGITFRRGRAQEAGEPISLWIPLIGSPLAAIAIGWWYWRDTRFFAQATVMPATVTSVGTVVMNDMCDVSISYDVHGTTHTAKRSVGNELAKQLVEGQTVEVYVVLEKPQQVRLVGEYS